MSAESPRQPAYPALFYPTAASAWDFRSGASGEVGADCAAAAAVAAIMDSRQPQSQRGHPQLPQHHQLHRHPHQQLPQQQRPAAGISRNPFDPQSRIPLPHPFGEFHFGCESSFIRRRNERERERVRFVNEGYERLKETLPFENKDKRISKVEILKTAIRYIQHMEALLRSADEQQQPEQRAEQPQSEHRSAAGSGQKRRPLSYDRQPQAESPEKRPRHS